MAVVGIDLGTTNTVVACVRDGQVSVLADDEGHHLLPSVVSFHPNGDVLVGREAKLRRLVDAKNTVASIKRLIGRPWDSDEMRIARSRFAFELREGPGQGALVVARGETYTLPEISAFVLKRAKQIAEAALGETVDKAVITVPAHFNELQRASTKVAGRVAGLEVLRILNEPTAAALAYGFGDDRSERIAVYDFGGGTFDCSILDLTGNLFEVLATSGDTFLGGDDVDTAIADVMCSAFLAEHRYDPRVDPQAFERLRAAAEELKRSLSDSTEAQIDIPDVAHGVEGRALGFTFGMTQADLDAIASPFIERTFEVTQDALSVANLSPSSLDKVVMVGGSTRMVVVARRVGRFFGIPVYDKVNPDEVVAVGAAVQAAALVDLGRSRSLPAAPTPGVIGPPPRMPPPTAVPGARSATPHKRIETLRPKPPTLFPSMEPPAPDWTPGEGTVTATLSATGEERSIATAPRGVLPLDDDTGERSFGSNQTLPARIAPHAADEPLSTTNIRVEALLGVAPPGKRPAPSVAQRPLPPPPPRQSSAFREPSTLKARAPVPLSPKHGIVRPLDTDDISLIGVTAVTMQKGTNPPPSAPDSQSLSPRGAKVGPLATEDISMLVPEGPGAFRNELSSTFASPTHADPPPFPVRVLPREPPLPVPRGRPPVPPPAASTFASFGAEPPPFAPAPVAEPAPFAPSPFAWPPLGENSPPAAAAPPLAEPFANRFSFDMPAPAGLQEPVRKEWPKPASPILVDVTPATLLVETVGGYCDTVITRNARIPCEHTRVFATGRDQQTTVQVRVAQGEEERFDGNQYLGEVELTGLRPASRGEVLLSVTFEIDANGSLLVSAVDSSTGRKVQAAMKLITVTQSEEMIEEMIERSRSVSVKARTS